MFIIFIVLINLNQKLNNNNQNFLFSFFYMMDFYEKKLFVYYVILKVSSKKQMEKFFHMWTKNIHSVFFLEQRMLFVITVSVFFLFCFFLKFSLYDAADSQIISCACVCWKFFFLLVFVHLKKQTKNKVSIIHDFKFVCFLVSDFS